MDTHNESKYEPPFDYPTEGGPARDYKSLIAEAQRIADPKERYSSVTKLVCEYIDEEDAIENAYMTIMSFNDPVARARGLMKILHHLVERKSPDQWPAVQEIISSGVAKKEIEDCINDLDDRGLKDENFILQFKEKLTRERS